MLFKISKNRFAELTEFEAFIFEDLIEVKETLWEKTINDIMFIRSNVSIKEKVSQRVYKIFIEDLKSKRKYLIHTLSDEEKAQDFLLKYLTDKSFRYTWEE